METCRVCSSWGLSEGAPEPARTAFDVLPMVLFFRLSGQHGYPHTQLQTILIYLPQHCWLNWNTSFNFNTCFCCCRITQLILWKSGNRIPKAHSVASDFSSFAHYLGVYRFLFCVVCPAVNQLVALEYTWDSASRSEDVLNASCVSQMDASRVLEIFFKTWMVLMNETVYQLSISWHKLLGYISETHL